MTDTKQTANAILRAFISGWYNEMECHVDGSSPKKKCDCSGCQLYRVAVQFLGSHPECKEETDAGFKRLWKDAKVEK